MKPDGFKRGNTNPKYFPNFPLISSKSVAMHVVNGGVLVSECPSGSGKEGGWKECGCAGKVVSRGSWHGS